MLLIPAIDLKEGKCVRLRQGRMDDDTVFSDDPVAVAGKWVAAGAKRIHLVDLDGAFAGKPVNADSHAGSRGHAVFQRPEEILINEHSFIVSLFR